MHKILFTVLMAFPIICQAQVLQQFECKPKSLPISNTDSLVSKIQSAYETVSTLKAKFIQSSYLSALDTAETSSGDVLFAKPGKMKWLYKAPEAQTFLVRDSTLWFYQPAEKQVTIDVLDKVLLSDLPVAFLMGLGNLSEKFSVQDACAAETGILIRFVPRVAPGVSEETEKLTAFSLLVSNNSYLPKGAEVLDLSSNKTSIFFPDVSINQAIPDDEFVAKFPKGTDTTDRRSTHNK